MKSRVMKLTACRLRVGHPVVHSVSVSTVGLEQVRLEKRRAGELCHLRLVCCLAYRFHIKGSIENIRALNIVTRADFKPRPGVECAFRDCERIR